MAPLIHSLKLINIFLSLIKIMGHKQTSLFSNKGNICYIYRKRHYLPMDRPCMGRQLKCKVELSVVISLAHMNGM